MMKDNFVVIMAGGIGSRFWPFSRENNPKQFQDILGTGQTLIQQTVERFKGICPDSNIYIVTNNEYAGLVKEQVPFLSDDQILLEPIMRNTAPCITYACYKIALKHPSANIVVTPADHLVLKPDTFRLSITTALNAVKSDSIIATIGIEPSRPDTGYGYIQIDNSESKGDLYKVKTFTEKPDLKHAIAFLESGDFVWNAGIFIWNASTIKKQFEAHLPSIHEIFSDLEDVYYTPEEQETVAEAYYRCKNISIDYGIMEKASEVFVLPSEFGWSDLGTWKSLFESAKKDSDNNVIQGNVTTYNTQNTIIKSSSDRLIVVEGMDNVIIAEHDNVLLICNKDKEQEIKSYRASAKEKGNEYC